MENSDYIVAVEVKSKPKNTDIDNFATRLEILRKYKDENNEKRRIRGAIAGAVFHGNVKSAVLEAGFYVIEQTGDTVKINKRTILTLNTSKGGIECADIADRCRNF
ncbi:MAG: hypothetical protein LBS35_00710 [Synergistaceae bacterium]|nr:hypothetical protein [Synergistaceae bacterium]